MWISKAIAAKMALLEETIRAEAALKESARGALARLHIENERLRADMDWFKLRLNHVERERGQLIQAAIGVKISVPEFVPSFEDPAEALNQMPDTSTVGQDASEDSDGDAGSVDGMDYSLMPGYKKR